MTQREMHILASYLNVDNGEAFESNVAHWIAKHFETIICGRIQVIGVGGLITHIARRLFDWDEDELVTLETPLPNPSYVSLAFLYKPLHYIEPVNPGARSKRFWWRLGTEHLVELPRGAGTLAAIIPMPHDPTSPVDATRYLLPILPKNGSAATIYARPSTSTPSGQPGTETRAEVPSSSRHYMTPMGDYSRFAHYPFQRPPYDVSYFDSSQYPETFVPPVPLAFPPLPLTQDSRDSMMLGMMHSFQQFQLDNAVGQHNIYAYHDRAGHFLPQDTHPGYYRPIIGQGSGLGGTPMTGGAGFMGNVGTAVSAGFDAGNVGDGTVGTSTGADGGFFDEEYGDEQFYAAP